MEKKACLILVCAAVTSGCASKNSSTGLTLDYKQPAYLAQAAVPVASDVAIIRNQIETVVWEKDKYQSLIRDGWTVQREYFPLPPPLPTQTVAEIPPAKEIAPLRAVLTTKIGKTVTFAFDSSSVTSMEKRKLKDGPWNDADEIFVDGHTDAIGTSEYNKALSMRRAEAVAKYLETLNIPRERIRVMGHGKSEPVATNKTESGRAKNRRVVVVLNVKSGVEQKGEQPTAEKDEK